MRPHVTRRRKFELSMQCWCCLNSACFDSALSAGMAVSAIGAHFAHVIRDYRVLARWRRPFRV